jgi:hypothetical protein
MKRDRIQLVRNLTTFLLGSDAQERYLIARCLADTLRGLDHDAALEADALCCALLPDARLAHAKIFSACPDAPPVM